MTTRTSEADGAKGAFPLFRGSVAGFVVHALLTLAALAALNWLVVRHVPYAIRVIGNSYLIFFYHFPAAINVFVFYGGVLAASCAYLATKDPVWDRRARVACEVGVLANAVLLMTGSTWARAAWGVWWRWEDPRLMSAAVMSLVYLGYLVLQHGMEDDARRRTYAAVYGILAFINIPIVHYSIRWFGEKSHPMEFSQLSDVEIVRTRWFGVLAFLLFYLLLYRWKYEREALRERAEGALQRLRELEEARAA
jgi:heme exporter protein C